MLLLGPVTVSQFAFADGADSPNACLSMNANTFSDVSGGTTTVTAGAGMEIFSICIADGNNSFEFPAGTFLKHSQEITANGSYGVGACYDVSGFEVANPTSITITDNCGSMAVSHVDWTEVMGSTPPGGNGIAVGGEFIGIDTTAVLVAGAQNTAAWMIPVLVAAAGLGIVIARKF
jgi:hypothetical protein